MKKFRTAFLNGYNRNAVDEYIEELSQELEREAENSRNAELSRRKLEEESEQQKEENAKLTEENEQLKEKLRKYESDYSGFMALMVNMKEEARKIVEEAQTDAEQVLHMAKKDADEITSAARQEAEKITKQAQTEAENYRKDVEEELEKRQKEEERQFDAARSRVAGYLESLNRSQNRLVEVYEEFGRVVEQLPLRLGDVFSEKPFELLEAPRKEGTDAEKS